MIKSKFHRMLWSRILSLCFSCGIYIFYFFAFIHRKWVARVINYCLQVRNSHRTANGFSLSEFPFSFALNQHLVMELRSQNGSKFETRMLERKEEKETFGIQWKEKSNSSTRCLFTSRCRSSVDRCHSRKLNSTHSAFSSEGAISHFRVHHLALV